VANTTYFEAHPTCVIDNQKRVWLAWDESGTDWGKDTGFLVETAGTQLYESRRVRVACWEGDRQSTTDSDVTNVLPTSDRWELPYLALDAGGHPVLFVRHLRPCSPDTSTHAPLYGFLWEIYATRYDGTAWSDPVRLPHSTGRHEMLPSAALDSQSRLWAVWGTDRRSTDAWNEVQSEIQISYADPTVDGGPLGLKPFRSSIPEPPAPLHPHEDEHVRRVRSYRINVGGKTYCIFRGDLHRHTDISADGGHDGSLLDAYRYGRDAAALDFLGVTNHNGNAERPYAWWRTQKMADLFQLENFVSFYSYERSVVFPNGHRNIYYTQRGHDVLPIAATEQRSWEGAEQLYAYLHRVNGFCIPHTTGRWSGTDWRDHDPKVESLVEVFQGMRDTYEHADAPKPKRLWEKFLDYSKPIPRAAAVPEAESHRPEGMVWEALGKGHKLGFIASSDHISTHISYACLLAERLTIASLLEAVRARRAYAATANILLDVRYFGSDGEHLMGEVFESSKPVRIWAKIAGTDVVRQVDVIKNGRRAHSVSLDTESAELEFVDEAVRPGESYYYVRVIQQNGDIAWGSPAWVTYP